mgnify:FL=1|tara:strand:- start:2018 stop:2938 length:921 start_codon:yes stop_codon:yes gene_type:complete
MSLLNQKTLNKAFTFEGVGLHSGKISTVNILPSGPNTGITFKRTDIKKNNTIIPSIFNVSEANYCTTVANEYGIKVSTIEHLMASLFVKGIDNAIIEIHGEEVPILDGSSMEFVKKIENVGIKNSNVPIKVIKINKPIQIKDGKKEMSILPSKINLEVDFEINFDNPLINQQRNKINVYEDDLSEIINSRTFCLFEDIEKLKKMNLAKGGSLENAVVVKGSEVLNENGLRNKKEFVNHKILDCLGDLFLSGYKIIGKVKSVQGGHKLTNELLRKVFSNKENYSLIEIRDNKVPSELIKNQLLKSIA